MGVFTTLQKNVDLVPDLDRDGPISCHELGGRDAAFRLVADIDNNVVRANVNDLPFDNIALFDLIAPEGFLVERRKALLRG